jgi:hypothetical protein
MNGKKTVLGEAGISARADREREQKGGTKTMQTGGDEAHAQEMVTLKVKEESGRWGASVRGFIIAA